MSALWSRIAEKLDIAALVLAVGGTAYILWSGAGTARGDIERAIADAEVSAANLDRALAEPRYDSMPGSKILESLRGLSARVRQQWEPRSEPAPGAAWLFHHPGALEDLRENRDPELKFFPPIDVVINAELGSIRLDWSPNDRSSVDVSEYVVYRAVGDGEEVAVATVPGDRTSWVDHDVQPGVVYSYRIASRTDNPALVATGHSESTRTRAVTARGKRDYEIEIVRFDEASKTVRARIRRYRAGAWHEKEFDLRVGESIGQTDPGSGIDYDTGCKLLEIRFDRERRTVTEDEVVFDAAGRVVVGEDGAPVRKKVTYEVPVTVVTLRFTNERGETETLVHRGS